MKLLREAIRKIILEGLRFGEDLMILNHPKDTRLFLLCKADYSAAMIGEMLDLEKFYDNNVIGMMRLQNSNYGPCNGALEIVKSGAKSGYGPTLYDSVMELTNGVINDRNSVSADAKVLMRKYKERSEEESSDIKKKLLDDRFDAKTYQRTHTTKDDCVSGDSRQYEDGIEDDGTRWEDDPLSYSYNKIELSDTVKGWKEKGDKFITGFESTGDVAIYDIKELGEMFFTDMFGRI